MNLPVMIASDLRAQIEGGILEPGDQLPGHRDLATTYAVSLGAAREAISMLIGDGLVETRAGRGTFIAEPGQRPRSGVAAPRTRKEMEELLEARELLGLSIAAMAAERASAAQVRHLREAVDQMQAAVADAAAWQAADDRFQLALADAAGNRFLGAAMEDIRSRMHRDVEISAGVGIQRFGSLQYAVDAHTALAAAIEAGDADEARSVLFEVMHRHHEFVIGLYALAPDGAA